MNTLKILSLFVGVSLFSLEASAQLQAVKTPNSANKRNISQAQADVKLDRIQLPEGFKIEVWAADVPNARSMSITEEGIVFVGNRQEKNVYALVDENGDGKADAKFVLAEGLRMPNGVAYKDGDLYVAEVSRILRFRDIKNTLTNPKFEVVYDGYPTESHHGWKFIAFGPDGMLYVPVGASCNICESEDEIYASITRIDPNSANPTPEIFAHGVRNSVGFDWHPETGDLWFTDNGRDMMGDNIPECELNHATEKGQHFGYPYWHAGTVKDPEFGNQGKAESEYVKPAAKLGPHVAPLGMRFYEGSMFPSDYKHQAIIAKHGSWNRSKKSGYEVVKVEMDSNGKVIAEKPFATGWLDDATQDVWGRPVDVQELPDGSLLISDDMANCIYRVSYAN
ncbi:PQQ-dependent sugar dehydrogenase [Algoriphagus hitonicola]|uniref:Glucose/arabinose dehydrogenase, beta-propeller fold n=1 Tax=Algoriphagus hitonicola TaxID=435880 RepID=A0A1I2VRG3_9BACT|nr:sorbosone dehydrogenase family protein [Algoriphagus hitonicola]SFG91935.1 Glucose/arabinose dehydrogenase, beta-propeller fold [Algoriphagus hitonicola]